MFAETRQLFVLGYKSFSYLLSFRRRSRHFGFSHLVRRSRVRRRREGRVKSPSAGGSVRHLKMDADGAVLVLAPLELARREAEPDKVLIWILQDSGGAHGSGEDLISGGGGQEPYCPHGFALFRS